VNYRYPQVQGGYRWNMLQRIEASLGFEPVATSDVQFDAVWQTCLTFDRALTDEEKAALDAVMADNPTFPPSSPTRFVVRDLFDQRDAIGAAIGCPYRVYYSQSTPDGPVDQVELHFSAVLTDAEKARVIEEYAKLIEEA
jgi:hypothetical protein